MRLDRLTRRQKEELIKDVQCEERTLSVEILKLRRERADLHRQVAEMNRLIDSKEERLRHCEASIENLRD